MGIFDSVVTKVEYIDNKDGTFTKWVKQGIVDTNQLKDEKTVLESLQSLTVEQTSKILMYSVNFDGKTIQQRIFDRIKQIDVELEKVKA